MNMKTGGGSATNAGIEYQQRVAACFQTCLYAQFEIKSILNDDFPLKVKSLHFETADAVDDLKLLCDRNHTIFLQIKRSITFSDALNSEFIKTLDQFILQQFKGGSNDYFVLVTSTDSSRRVTGELRKILTNIRLNDTGFKLNPLNKSEKDVYSKFKTAFFERSLFLTGKKTKDKQFIDFSKKIYIEIMDIETGMPLEKSVKLLLGGKMQNPDLVWALLIKNSLTYASNRASINQDALANILNAYQIQEKHSVDQNDYENILRETVLLEGEYSCNKEVLILLSEDENENHVMEIERFSDDCSKQLSFSNNQVKFPKLSKPFNLIYRGSSATGLSRFLEQDVNILNGKPLFVLDSNPIDASDHEVCVSLHQEYLKKLSNENINMSNCLHCGKLVGKSKELLIEIDDNDTASAVGICHLTCRRPMDRVLGTARRENELSSPFLEDFDINQWVSLIIKGGIVHDSLSNGNTRKMGVAWSGIQNESDGDFCIKFQMEDGTNFFAFHREKIERMNEKVAKILLNRFKEQLQIQKKNNDPYGFTKKHRQYGVYSRLLLTMDLDDEFVEIQDVVIARYSQQEAKLHNTGRMYYAPLCHIIDNVSREVFTIGNIIPIISNPETFDTLVKSWQRAGIEVKGISLKILKSDYEVDLFFANAFSNDYQLVINPKLDLNAELVDGVFIRAAEEILKDEGERELKVILDPNWKNGNLVQVTLEDEEGTKIMYGQLIADELLHKNYVRVVKFQPIENAEPLEDVAFIIPSEFISDWDGIEPIKN